MNRRVFILSRFVLAFVLVGFATSSYARVRVGTLAGTVVDAHGKPVPHATVTIQTSFGDHPNATHTNEQGRFQFARFLTGQYDLQAYSQGAFSKWLKRINIRSNHTTEVILHMPPTADVVVNVNR
ncbi:MAG: carboxypeptidase-like regulatory domain-containing protein [Candidatus Acidiferrales bacterium]